MNPVRGRAMINFIEWVDRTHPEVDSLKILEKEELLSLVNEFEGGELNGNETLRRKWEAGFEYFLFKGNSNWQEYDIAREKLNEFEKSKKNRTYKDDFKSLGISERDRPDRWDYLARRKEVPLRAMFLYTSEDRIIENYIKRNYDALDSISGNYCDIYFSVDQLFYKENAYDHLDEVQIIKEARNINISNLPGIIFWDGQGQNEYVQFEIESGEFEIIKRLRLVFEEIRKNPSIESIKRVNKTFKQQIHKSVQRILFASANPKNTSPIRIDEEVREIENGLRRSLNRDIFDFKQTHASRISDFRRAILDFNPNIIHFSGHGERDGILLENEIGLYQKISSSALENFFKLFREQIECVILNSCYSKTQAQAIANHIPFVVGMNDAIPDSAAIKFSTAFYDALGAGRNIEFAFDLGVNSIEFEGLTGNNIPELIRRNEY